MKHYACKKNTVCDIIKNTEE